MHGATGGSASPGKGKARLVCREKNPPGADSGAGGTCYRGVKEGLYLAACVTVTVLPPTVTVPVLVAPVVFA